MPNVPHKTNCKGKNCFSPFLYRNRIAIERAIRRLEDFCRVAKRYDRNAVNFLGSAGLAAVICYMSPDPKGARLYPLQNHLGRQAAKDHNVLISLNKPFWLMRKAACV